MDLNKLLGELNEKVTPDETDKGGERLSRDKYEAVIFEVVDKFKNEFPQFKIEAEVVGSKVILRARGKKFAFINVSKKTGEE